MCIAKAKLTLLLQYFWQGQCVKLSAKRNQHYGQGPQQPCGAVTKTSRSNHGLRAEAQPNASGWKAMSAAVLNGWWLIRRGIKEMLTGGEGRKDARSRAIL